MDNKVFKVLLAFVMIFTALRTLNLPFSYPIYYWLLDYDIAFVRRGLVGHLLHIVFPNGHGDALLILIISLSSVILAGLLYSYYRVLSRMHSHVGQDAPFFSGPLLALASSPFVLLSTHCVGFFDNLLALIAIVSVNCVFSNARHRLWIIPALTVISVLTHEIYLVFGLPAVLFAVIAKGSKQYSRLIGLTVVVALLTYAILSISAQRLAPDDLAAIRNNILAKKISTLDHSLFFLNGVNPVADDLKQHWEAARNAYKFRIAFIHGNSSWNWLASEGLLDVLPTLVVLLGCFMACRRYFQVSHRLTALAIVVTIAPAALCIVAHDMVRFLAMMLFNGLLCFYALIEVRPALEVPTGRNASILAAFGVAVALINANLQPNLLDTRRELHHYPFRTHMHAWIKQAIELDLN